MVRVLSLMARPANPVRGRWPIAEAERIAQAVPGENQKALALAAAVKAVAASDPGRAEGIAQAIKSKYPKTIGR